MSERLSVRSLRRNVLSRASKWNLFDSRSSNPSIIRREILSTRLYVILILISFIILIAHTSISNRVENKRVEYPSEPIYHNLQEKYSDSLRCSCSKVSVSYGKFSQAVATFHQVCSTGFVSQEWIDFIFQVDIRSIVLIDVRTSLSAMWQLIRSFCKIARNATEDALDQFRNVALISQTLSTRRILEAKTQVALDIVRHTAASNFIQSLKLAQKMAQANQVPTALGTNYIAVSWPYPEELNIPDLLETEVQGALYVSKNSTKVCSCKDDGSCPLPGNLYLYTNNIKKLQIYDLNKIEANASLPGITIDCLPIQTTLSSSLECFYNQSCLDILLSTYQEKFHVSILSHKFPSRFYPNTAINALVEELFIEEILNHTNYSKYYTECAPYSCSYQHIYRFNWISVVTVIIAVFGGIVTVLRISTPLMLQLILFVKQRFFSKKQAAEQTRQIQNETMRVRLWKFSRTVKFQIIHFNLYNSASRDPVRIHRGILTTRLYLLLLLTSVCACIFFFDFSSRTMTVKITNPSEHDFDSLQKRSPSALTCPCTDISSPYANIIEFQVTFHQICSSHFIQPSWYELFSLYYYDYDRTDFTSIASSYFQTLEAFCFMANDTIHDATQRFSAGNLISPQLLTQREFHSQVNASINALKQLTQTEFSYRTNLTNAVLDSNQYLSRTVTSTRLLSVSRFNNNVLHSIVMQITGVHVVHSDRQRCFCVIDPTCYVNRQLSSDNGQHFVDWRLEGMHGGCSTIHTVMGSSLGCWYKMKCLEDLRDLVNRPGLSIPDLALTLDPTIPSRYSTNTTIRKMFEDIMVEEWNYSLSFSNYFSICNPSSCSYTYQKKPNVIHIVTHIIGLIGGIHIVLDLIAPVIISVALKIINDLKRRKRLEWLTRPQDEPHRNGRIGSSAVHLMNAMINKLFLLNLFDDESTDMNRIRRQRVSTRVYIPVVSTAIYMIMIYSVFSGREEIRSFSNISQSDYNQSLYAYPDSLDCPCKKISIEYKYFIQMNTTFHTICSSDFIGRKWRDFLFSNAQWHEYDRRDIRVRGAAYFVFLSTLCQISQVTVNNAIDRFLNGTFVSVRLIPQTEFDMQIKNVIIQFQNDTVTKFSRSLQLLREILNGNAFVSSYSLNWYWFREVNSTFEMNPTASVEMRNKCSCGTRSDCTDAGGVYDTWTHKPKFIIRGWNVGCSVVETVLRSTFQSLYDPTLLSLLLTNLYTFPFQHFHPIDISTLTIANTSKFRRDALIQTMADELFVEEWHINASYLSYFNECGAYECFYAAKKDDYAVHAVSTILGLYGGITFVLRNVIPFIVKHILSIRNQCRANAVASGE